MQHSPHALLALTLEIEAAISKEDWAAVTELLHARETHLAAIVDADPRERQAIILAEHRCLKALGLMRRDLVDQIGEAARSRQMRSAFLRSEMVTAFEEAA
jgi:hypothetical protein